MATVMIVDDDQQIRKLLGLMLANAGYHILVASNGVEAVKAYKEQPSDIVLTDIIMPEKDGIETIRDLKGINPDVQIIAISGGGLGNPDLYLDMAEKMGAAATIMKPIDRNELLSTIDQVASNLA